MISNSPPGVARCQGLTTIELAVCVAALIFLNSILLTASRAWMRGSDRVSCVLTLHNMQLATRGYQNMHGYDYGSQPAEENETRNIAKLMYAKGYIDSKLYQQATGNANCPAGGTYSLAVSDVFPPVGQLYMNCSLSVSADHVPTSHEDW